MALQTLIAKPSGTLDAMSVLVTVYDDAYAEISLTDAVVRAQVDAPVSFFGVAQDANPHVERLAPHMVAVRISYRYRRLSALQRPLPGVINTVQRYVPPMFTKPKTLHTYLAEATVYDKTNTDVSTTYPEMRWAIDLPMGPFAILATPGHLFEPSPVTRGFHFYLENASVTDAYLDTIEDMVQRGVWNDAPFLGCEAGTVQFVSFSAQERTPDDWDLDFGFGRVAKKTSVQVTADITLPTVYGYQYWYERFEILPITVGGNVVQTIQQTEFVVLGDVWELDDFSQLNLPS